jgi:hypothetical protein
MKMDVEIEVKTVKLTRKVLNQLPVKGMMEARFDSTEWLGWIKADVVGRYRGMLCGSEKLMLGKTDKGYILVMFDVPGCGKPKGWPEKYEQIIVP